MARVLAIDDDAGALAIRKLLIERQGHEVIVAENATAARAAFRESNPDVVICDLRVPDVQDGLALIREFHGHARMIVLCGNRADIEGREEARMVETILVKPLRSEMLFRSIDKTRPI
jgi:two-component system, NtrC family, nitrogen regulation response regulator NtrX